MALILLYLRDEHRFLLQALLELRFDLLPNFVRSDGHLDKVIKAALLALFLYRIGNQRRKRDYEHFAPVLAPLVNKVIDNYLAFAPLALG